jgi:hypothetical protein
MQFQTHIQIRPFDNKIDHREPILSLGSCFADNIAKRLQRAKFNTTAAPTGILFNPESIARTIERFDRAREDKDCLPTIQELHQANGVWYNYDFHSSLSHIDADIALSQMSEAVRRGAEALATAKVVIITFGTAFVYRLHESGEVVANCHKQPQRLFSREMLSAEDIVQRYNALLQGPLANKRVIFTLSPVRHLGDGLEQNSLSKATLRVAIAEIVAKNSNADYFPSYEIMMDELRDYRFYADDMAHPSKLAVDYIWERFSECAFSGDTLELIKRIAQITSATEHRPFNPQSDAYRNFCQQMLQKIATLELSHPTLDFTTEKEHFKRYL